jgi:hypothetical protein
MAAVKYIVGQRFHFLTYLRDAPSGRLRKAVFLCDCGNEVVAYIGNVKRGNTKSCGCFRRENSATMATVHGRANISDRAYASWVHMRGRCLTPTDPKYPDYGGRGIKICERWMEFENFLEDMGEPPPGLTIDRYPDNDGDYEPGNCRWATPEEQANNRRSSRFVELGGERLTIAEWSRRTGIDHRILQRRIASGVSPEIALDPDYK